MNSKRIGKQFHAAWPFLALLALAAIAASIMYEADAPYFGYIAGPATNQAKIASGNAVAYVPWFDTQGFDGDLIASPISTSGDIDLDTRNWSAANVMTQAETLAPSTYWNTGRFIVTTNLAGVPVPFRLGNLDANQVTLLAAKNQNLVIEYLRGSRAEEGKKFGRVRDTLLGTFMHSTPVYVGYPDSGYTFDGYAAFAAAQKTRAGRVYVGGNDGMLHAFDAATGRETFAFIPSTLMAQLGALTVDPYTHHYFVDGPLTAADVYYGGAWHTVLLGALGHGGRGVFALDVTSAGAIISENNSSSGAGSHVLWEVDSNDAANLGYTHAKIAVGKMANGRWVAVVANGYGSPSGRASLLFVDIQTGAIVREIVVADASANGMSGPTLIDVDDDHVVDYAYAGDLNGNLWKFDLRASSPASWTVAYSGAPLFRTENNLSITAAPEIGYHPVSGFMVYAATGRLLGAADATDETDNYVYGIWDHDWQPTDMPLHADTGFVTQTLALELHDATDQPVRVASDEPIDWHSNVGWRVSLQTADEMAKGWRVLTPLTLRNGRVHLVASSPLGGVGKNWYLQLDALTGGAPRATIVDIDRDGHLDVDDNVDGNGDGMVEDVPEDRIVGIQERVGLASAPTIRRLSAHNDVALFNHLAQTGQVYVPPGGDGSGDPEDAGLLGGHIDLDVSSQTYLFNKGTTDKHTHQWDDKWDTTVIDLFDIWGGYRSVDDMSGVPGKAPTKPFLINVANAHLSTAGILEINGVGTPVVEHRQRIKRMLTGKMFPGERAPIYTLSPPTQAQYDAGVRQLTSLRLVFPSTAILAHGLVATQTGCVRGNQPGFGDEYRNGALTIQLLDASVNLTGAYAFDAVSQTYYKPGGGGHRIHALGYAVPFDLGKPRVGDGLLHESTVFHHWKGACYTKGNEAQYQKDYQTLFDTEWNEKTDADLGDGTSEDDEDGGDGGSDSPVDGDPLWGDQGSEASEVSTAVILATDRLGRLFWREIIPEN